MRASKAAFSLRNCHFDKNGGSDWSWLERWMASKPWENRFMAERTGGDLSTASHSLSSEFDSVKVRRNNMTTKVSAAKPPFGQIMSSSSDLISGSVCGETSTSTSTSEASRTPVMEESTLHKPGYMNLTESSRAKLRAYRYANLHNMRSHIMADPQFCNKSVALSSCGETRSIADSNLNPPVFFSQDLYPPLRSEGRSCTRDRKF